MAIYVAMGVGFATAPPVAAQTVYDGNLDSTDQAEVVAWATLFWQRIDQGGGSPGAGFAFTKAEMNSHLFNPLRAARPTLEKVGAIAVDACDKLEFTLPMSDPTVAETYKAFREAMIEGKITTDWVSDSTGSAEHVNLILATPASAGLTVEFEDTTMISFDLPLEKVSQIAYDAALKDGLSPQSQNVIAALIASGAEWSVESGTITEAQGLITGQRTQVDNFLDRVRWLLNGLNVSGGEAQYLSAQFNLYGSLPLVVVQLSDAAVLVDPTTGNVAGPFQKESPIDARSLLSAHPEAYKPADAVRYYNWGGKQVHLVSEAVVSYPCAHPLDCPKPPATCVGTGTLCLTSRAGVSCMWTCMGGSYRSETQCPQDCNPAGTACR